MKNFKFYALIWVIGLATFNAIVFLARSAIAEYAEYGAGFWVAWTFTSVAFAGNLACAYYAFKADNLRKLFYRLPLVTISWSALCAILITGSILMLIPGFPAWLAAMAMLAILAFNAIAIIKAAWAADIVENADAKIKEDTRFVKNLAAHAQGLLSRAKSEAVKADCQKVYEAIRYSDPKSSPDLSAEEAEIAVKMDEFAGAVGAADAEKAKTIADELIALIDDRNRRCKLLK